ADLRIPLHALREGVREVRLRPRDRRRVPGVRELERDAQAVGVRSAGRRQLHTVVDDVDRRLLRRQLRLPLTRATLPSGSLWTCAASRCSRRWLSWGASLARPTPSLSRRRPSPSPSAPSRPDPPP